MKYLYQQFVTILLVFILILPLKVFGAYYNKTFIDTTKVPTFQPTIIQGDTILSFAEKMPEFPGGKDSMIRFFASNLKYPLEAYQNGVEGKVTLQFVVTKEGKIDNVKTLKGIGWGCDDEAIRVVKLMPEWFPGRQKGNTVSVYITLPIWFLPGSRADQKSIDSLALETPSFPGGNDSLYKFLERNIKHPKDAEGNGIGGKVLVKFKVTKNGKIMNPYVVWQVEQSLIDESLRIVRLFPDWQPAIKDKKAIDSDYTLEFTFERRNEKLGYADSTSLISPGGQKNKLDLHDDEPLSYVEEMPEFPGGINAMMRYLFNNIKYPEFATKLEITGKVVLQFVIDREGNVTNVKILRSIGGGCDEEAMRVVKSMPRWNPGKQNGKVVPVYFTMPIIFELKEDFKRR